ncbi:MAG: asparagine synthetase A [Conexivisphaerales archaeon]
MDDLKDVTMMTQDELNQKREYGIVTTHILHYATTELVKTGFQWLLPVILSKSTDPLWPDPGASIEKRIQAEIYGDVVNLTSSMIIHKMVSSSLLHPKFFILSPNVRIEKRERGLTGWHAYEFTQLDFEIRDGTFEDVRSLVEKLLTGIIRDLRRALREVPFRLGEFPEVSKPFDVYDRIDLVQKFGEHWETELPRSINNPVWVRNIPREFYDFEDLSTGIWDNYDLYVPRYGEILSGARREFEYSKIHYKMERDGVKKENYRLLLQLAKENRLQPSAGAGIGIERLVTWITGAKRISDIQPFPKVPGIVLDL